MRTPATIVNGSLANFGLDPGLSGTWWNPAKGGEGFLLEVGYPALPSSFMFLSTPTVPPANRPGWLQRSTLRKWHYR